MMVRKGLFTIIIGLVLLLIGCNKDESYLYVIIERENKSPGQNKIDFINHIAQSGYFNTVHVDFPEKDTTSMMKLDRFDIGPDKWFNVQYHEEGVSIVFRSQWDEHFYSDRLTELEFYGNTSELNSKYYKLFREFECDTIFLSNRSNPFNEEPKPMFK